MKPYVLLILMLLWGCGQETAPKKEEYSPPDSLRSAAAAPDTLDLHNVDITNWRQHARQSAPPETVPSWPCLYQSEYDVCKVRGHTPEGGGWVYPEGGGSGYTCRYCRAEIENTTITKTKEVKPPTK